MPQADSPATGFRPFFNPATGEWITYTALAEDSDGQLVRFNWRSVPGGVITEHVHPHQEERFTIIAGEAHFTLNGEEHVAGAGETVVVPAGRPALRGQPRAGRDRGHRRAPPGTARQGVARGPRRPGGRRQDHAQGRAANPLQLGATFWHFRHESRVTSPPIWAQNLMLPPCGHWRRPSAYAPTTTTGTAGSGEQAEATRNPPRRNTEMNVTDPIRRVSVVSTGQVQIRPDHLASTWRPTAWWLLASRRWTGPRPINAYVIEHRDGLVLFDTGQDRASVTDPGYFPGGMTGVLYDRLARFEISPDETLSAGLGRLGYAAGDVRPRSSPISTRTTSAASPS